MLLRLESSQREPLTEQIVKGIGRLVDDRALRPGTRLPSIRQFAADHNVSNFTVVHAYDQLVVSGYIQSRHGAGFFVRNPSRSAEPAEAGPQHERARDVLWLLRNQTGQNCFKHRPGSGWLPHMWLAEAGLDRAMRELARRASTPSTAVMAIRWATPRCARMSAAGSPSMGSRRARTRFS